MNIIILLSSGFLFCPPLDRFVSSEVIFKLECIQQQYCACAFTSFWYHREGSRFRIAWIAVCRRPNMRGPVRRTPLTWTLWPTTEYRPKTDRHDRGPATVRIAPSVHRWPNTVHRRRRAVKCRRADAQCRRGWSNGHHCRRVWLVGLYRCVRHVGIYRRVQLVVLYRRARDVGLYRRIWNVKRHDRTHHRC